MTRPAYQQAKARWVNRYTMEHVPSWARIADDNGKYYAPQFATDMEWYENTLFPGEAGHVGTAATCYTTGQTWPLGQWLDQPFPQGPADRSAFHAKWLVGKRVEIPVHYDMWMRGARYGRVTRWDSKGVWVRLDHKQAKRSQRVWNIDLTHLKTI
jgi:hypothetical protein